MVLSLARVEKPLDILLIPKHYLISCVGASEDAPEPCFLELLDRYR